MIPRIPKVYFRSAFDTGVDVFAYDLGCCLAQEWMTFTKTTARPFLYHGTGAIGDD